jgi:hypothetical protein
MENARGVSTPPPPHKRIITSKYWEHHISADVINLFIQFSRSERIMIFYTDVNVGSILLGADRLIEALQILGRSISCRIC